MNECCRLEVSELSVEQTSGQSVSAARSESAS
jgi:hypothetical protein